jgi:magnesium chelatase family protein
MKTARLSAIYLEENLFAERIHIEAIIRPGLPVFRITGINGRSRDREERIRTALLASGIQFPYCTVLVNLSPAGRVHDSALLDLPVAVCLMLAIGVPKLRQRIDRQTLFIGELSLTGEICDLPELAGWALCGADAGFSTVYLPWIAGKRLPVGAVRWIGVRHLSDIIEGRGEEVGLTLESIPRRLSAIEIPERIMRMLILAAAGKHALLFVGPPGSGKSIAARLLYDLLPDPDPVERRRIIKNGLLFRDMDPAGTRPLRQPHHTITVTGMVGGGTPLRAGEANRASDGLLLLDELSEYDRRVIEALREPLETHEISHNRGGRPGRLPARFWLAATANPCPCGFFHSKAGNCQCSHIHIKKRRQLLSGPFGDRIDLQTVYEKGLPAVLYTEEDLQNIRQSILQAVEIQRARNGSTYNGELTGTAVDDFCRLADEEAELVWLSIRENALSRRRSAGIRRLARTIADLDRAPSIRAEDLLEARSYSLPDDFWEAPPPHSDRFRPRRRNRSEPQG